MLDVSLISQIKDSTIAIALADSNRNPIEVLGSGVVVDPDGYFITAGHVIQNYQDRQKRIKIEKGIDTWLSIFSYIAISDEKHLIFNRIGNYGFLKSRIPMDNVELDFDIAFGDLVTKEKNHPFLKIDSRLKHDVLTEIFICGYPGGEITFHPSGTVLDISYSPVIQPGRISSLMPADNANTSQGIITDLIGTGGSSGSPIIDANTGTVIGIAQTVIGSSLIATTKYEDSMYVLNDKNKLVETVGEKKTTVSGYSQIGLIIGASNSIFGDIPKAIEQMKNGAKIITGLKYKASKEIPLYTIEGSPV